MPDEFDVFISYKSEYKPWVETLAENLTAQGLEVWLDDWRKVAGDRVSLTLEVALQKSKNGVIVVTPEAAQSGWVQREYDTMMSLVAKKPGFRCIPAILRKTDGFPFLNTVFTVDFRDPAHYGRRLYELVRGLRGQAAEPQGSLNGNLRMPPPLPEPAGIGQAQAKTLFDRVFDALNDFGIVALFAQEGMAQGGAAEQLMAAAKAKFQPHNVLHVVPPCCTDEQRAEYFAHVARRCEIEGEIKTANQLGMALRRRLESAVADLLIILTDFENGPDGARRELAGELRNLKDQYGNRLRLIFRGGEKLAQLKYVNPMHSVLNVATSEWWPELTAEEIKGLFEKRYPDRQLPLDQAQAILAATGGEPRLVSHCLRRRHELAGTAETEACADVRSSDVVAQFFRPLKDAPRKSFAKACQMVAQEDLGVFTTPHFDDVVVRRLFWHNALKRRVDRSDRLVWRSSVFPEVGREILGCG